jgi:hypothetical protein
MTQASSQSLCFAPDGALGSFGFALLQTLDPSRALPPSPYSLLLTAHSSLFAVDYFVTCQIKNAIVAALVTTAKMSLMVVETLSPFSTGGGAGIFFTSMLAPS